MYLGTFIGNNNGSFKLANIRHIQSEVSLQGQFNLDSFGNIDK